jgi:carbon storage regulator
MLCFDRQLDEQIVIGDDIVITVVHIKGRKVRIGIDAPREIRVDRQEVRDAIERERKDGAA